MKMLKYIALSLLVAASTTACQDEPELLTTDIGPEMTAITTDASGVYGGKISFEVTLNDQFPLSTLKAQVFFDDQMVAEEVIRTKTNGTYEGAVTLPFYKDIPDGDATLRLVAQNIRFGSTTVEKSLSVMRPKPAYLNYVLGEQEYRMEPTGNAYEYAVTDNFPQKPKGYIATPELDALGSVVTFGYDTDTRGVTADSMEPIPFANSNAGEYTISFNILSFEGAPFIKLLFDGTEMTMLDDNNYYIVTSLTQNRAYSLTGIADFADWNVDMDFFERADASDAEKLTFLPMSGLYKVTANFKHNYLKIEAMKSDTELATLNADGTGALWAIGGMEVGKPSLKNAFSWSPEDGGLCLARVSDKKYQLTLVGGISLNASAFDFKFFHQKTWGGEFGGKDISTASDLVAISESGNLGLVEGKKFDLGGVYRFTVDLSGGNTAAVLTVEKVGEQPLPPADITVNGTAMTQLDVDNYQVDLDLTQGQKLTFGGADAFLPAWLDDNFLAVNVDGTASLRTVDGKYRIKAHLGNKFISVSRLNAEGGDATTAENGTGGLWLMGWGVGSPSQEYQFGFNAGAAYCLAELSPGVYTLTGKAGPETDSVFGQYFRADYMSIKYFFQNGWGGEMKNPTLEGGLLKDGGNLELNDGVTLDLGVVYELKIDLTAGRDKGKVSFVKK